MVDKVGTILIGELALPITAVVLTAQLTIHNVEAHRVQYWQGIFDLVVQLGNTMHTFAEEGGVSHLQNFVGQSSDITFYRIMEWFEKYYESATTDSETGHDYQTLQKMLQELTELLHFWSNHIGKYFQAQYRSNGARLAELFKEMCDILQSIKDYDDKEWAAQMYASSMMAGRMN